MRFNRTTISLAICSIFIIYLLLKRNSKLVNLKLILKQSLYASEMGGLAILRSKGNLVVKKKGLTKEGMEDKVTSADFLSHCSMVYLMKQFSYLNIISEEADTLCSEQNFHVNYSTNDSLDFLQDEWVNIDDLTVWIDPLDATQEFTEKLYQYVTTMVCVAYEGRPIIGVIHKPFQNITSWAWVGKGESYDLKNRENMINSSDKLKITISRSHSGQIREALNKKFDNYELVVAAGAGYKSLQVAYHEVDAYIHSTAIKKWDICAGNAILEALGGQMTDKNNDPIDYSVNADAVNENGLLATMKNHKIFLGVI